MITEVSFVTKSIKWSLSDGEKEIGRAWLALIKNDLHTEPYGLLEDVWVDPDHRGQGHATTLVQAVIERAKQEGCHKLIANSRLERIKVHELYKHLGFISYGLEFRMDFLV
jgi:GNAT superfamily N-acetyltransferase